MRQSFSVQMKKIKADESERGMIRNSLMNNESNQYYKSIKNNKTNFDKSKKKVFDGDFMVESMLNPHQFIPNYNQGKQNTTTCVQQCLTCIGGCQLLCVHIFALCGCKCCVYQLSTSSAGLVEQFGKFHRLLNPGFNMINPCSEQVAQVDLRIQIVNAGRNSVITKDNVKLTINLSAAFRITNPITVHYVLGNSLNKAIIEAVISTFRSTIGQHVLDFILQDRLLIIREAKEQIVKMVPPGIRIQEIFLEDIQIPHQIQQDLSSVAKERRLAEAQLIQSKGDVEAASLMKKTAELLDTKAAMQIRYLQLVESLRSNSNKVIMEIGVNKKGFKL